MSNTDYWVDDTIPSRRGIGHPVVSVRHGRNGIIHPVVSVRHWRSLLDIFIIEIYIS
jgi:hypothetical protein